MARIDPPDAQARQQLVERLQQARQQHPHARAFALLDLSFADAALREALASLLPQPLSLLCGHYAGEGLENVDVWLAELPPPEAEPVLALAGLCAGQPMFSIILAPVSPDRLQAHLRQQLEACDDQGTLHILRWADTRCLPSLHRCFDAPQQARLMAGLNAWIYLDRDGRAELIAGHPQGRSGTPFPSPYSLSATQALALRKAAQPDMLLDFIAAHPQRYGRLSGLPSLQHASACAALSKLTQPATTAEAVRAVAQSLHMHGRLES